MAIPLPSADYAGNLIGGMQSGADFYNKLIAPQLERDKLAQQMKIHGDLYSIQKQQQDRLQKKFELEQQDREMLNNIIGSGGGKGIDMNALRNNPLIRGAFRKRFGMDPALETPEERQQREIDTKREKEQQTIDIKRLDSLRSELPKSQHLIDRIKEAVRITKQKPHLFGPGTLGFDILGGPGQRYRGLKNPKDREDFKTVQNLFALLQGQQAQDFASRSLKTAFDLAKESKMSMADWPESVGKSLSDILEKMEPHYKTDLKWYNERGGEKFEKPQRKTGKLVYNPVTGRIE